jgi:hypothetical protein
MSAHNSLLALGGGGACTTAGNRTNVP